MPTKKELYDTAELLGIKGISQMTTEQLEVAVLIHLANEWYDELIDLRCDLSSTDNQ